MFAQRQSNQKENTAHVRKEDVLMLKLYYSPGACSLAPHIVLQEIAEPFEIELISSMDGSTTSKSYLEINPKGRVPVLRIGEKTITEVPAIMTYLALTYPQSQLLSDAPKELARSIEWMNWCVERFSNEV